MPRLPQPLASLASVGRDPNLSGESPELAAKNQINARLKCSSKESKAQTWLIVTAKHSRHQHNSAAELGPSSCWSPLSSAQSGRRTGSLRVLVVAILKIALLLRPPDEILRPSPSSCKSVAAGAAAPGQYVASLADELADEQAPPVAAASTSRQHDELAPSTSSGLIEYLQSLPISSVGLKHKALVECSPIEEMKRNPKLKLVWLKLLRTNATRPPDQTGPSAANLDQNDITLLSVGERLVTPDKRFRVQHQPPSKWTLTIDTVGQQDDRAYFLCQAAGGGTAKGAASFLGGAQLKVLVPPKIVELETSPNLVQVDEFGPLRLQCKVISEPKSQISWRREDGRSLEGFEQRLRHHTEGRPPHQVVSVESAELLTGAVRREQAGAYLCIASNGVQPGVSQRISVIVVNCRQSAERAARTEPCGQLEPASEPAGTTTTTTTTTTTKRPQLQQQSSGWSARARNNGRGGAFAANSTADQQFRRTQQQDKSARGSRYNGNQLRRANQTNQQRRLQSERTAAAADSSSSPFQCTPANCLQLVAALALAWAHCRPAPTFRRPQGDCTVY